MAGNFNQLQNLVKGAKACYHDGLVAESLDRLKKVKELMQQQQLPCATVDSLIARIEGETAKCEECQGPLDAEAIDGFCSKCLDAEGS